MFYEEALEDDTYDTSIIDELFDKNKKIKISKKNRVETTQRLGDETMTDDSFVDTTSY
jgi:hypothetical protein